jgi:hypothetical protein
MLSASASYEWQQRLASSEPVEPGRNCMQQAQIKPLFSSPNSPQILLCKKKIPCHIEMSANAWSTKC